MSEILENRPSILIVDDAPENIDILKAALIGLYSVRAALNGDIALKIATSVPPPDLILLDILMPEMNGFQVLQALQADPTTRDIPVIFITALTDMENEIRGLEAGAVDYITKPFNPPVVRTRVATHLALCQARRALEKRNTELLNERSLVEDLIVRMRSHRQFDDRHLRYLITPVERANGDLLLATFTPDGTQWILVGDFTGHGLPAAMAAPLVAQVFYRDAAAGVALERTIATLNEIMCQQLPVSFFMACGIVEVAPDRSSCRFWRGGLPESLLFSSSGTFKDARTQNGILPLGIVADMDIATACEHLPLERGDRLYLLSDGVSETMNPQGEMFGSGRLRQFLATRPASAPLEDLLQTLESFHGGREFDDDITLVEISA